MPNGFGAKEKEAIRQELKRIVDERGLVTKYPHLDWDTLLDSYFSGRPSGLIRTQTEASLVNAVITEAERRGLAQVKAPPAQEEEFEIPEPTEWAKFLVGLSAEDADFYRNFKANVRSEAKRFNLELTSTDQAAIQDYFMALVKARTNAGQEAIPLEIFLNSAEGQNQLAMSNVVLPSVLNYFETTAPAEKPEEIAEEYRPFVQTEFRGLPMSLQKAFTRLTEQAMGEKRLEIAGETGRKVGEIPVQEALSRLTEEEIGTIRQTAIHNWMIEEEQAGRGIPLAAPMQQLLRASEITGMEPYQYLQSAYQDWRAGLHPSYIQERGEEKLWDEFVNYQAEPYIARDVTLATSAVGAEKKTVRGQLTPLYEYAPPPMTLTPEHPTQLMPGGEPTEGITETGKWQKAAEQPAGEIATAGRPMLPVSQAVARKTYLKELERRGYGTEDVAYLSQFFNTLIPGPWPKLTELGQLNMKDLEIPSPPRREAPKTRFLRRR
jgi:hypothetical protein